MGWFYGFHQARKKAYALAVMTADTSNVQVGREPAS